MLTGGLRHDEECDSNAVGQGEIMTGLFLIAVVVLWAWIAVFIARALTIRVKRALVRRLGATILALVLLPLPVADELIAAPQFRALCEEGTKLKFDPQAINGMTVYRQPSKWPFPQFSIVGLDGYYLETIYTDQPDGKPVISYKWYSIKGGILIRVLGISEKTAPLTFKGSCRPLEEPWQQSFLALHKLTIIEIKDSK